MALNLDYDHAWKPDAPTSAGPDFDFDPNWKPAPEPKGGLVASAKQAIGSTIKGAGQAAADFLPGIGQDNALKTYGQSVVDANPTAVSSLADLKDKPLTGIAEATGNAGGSMGAMLGARALGMGITAASPLAGPAAPLIAGLGQAVSWAGPAAAAALPSFGGIREKQIQDDPTRQDSVGSKLLAAAGAGTVGLIESKLGPNKWAEMALSKQGRDALAEKFVANSLAGSIAKGAAKGAAIEGAEELAQNPIEQLASYQNPLTAENLKDTAFSGVMGALGGGVLGGASGAAFRGNPEKPGQNPAATPGDQSIPYSPTTVEEVAKARAEAMGIKPENGPLSVASGMAIEGQTAEEMRLSTPGILAQGAAVAEQSRIEQEARQAADPGIPFEHVAADPLRDASIVPTVPVIDPQIPTQDWINQQTGVDQSSGVTRRDFEVAAKEQADPQIILDESGRPKTTASALEIQQFHADFDRREALRQRKLSAAERLRAARSRKNIVEAAQPDEVAQPAAPVVVDVAQPAITEDPPALGFTPQKPEPMRATADGQVGTPQQFDDLARTKATRKDQMRRAEDRVREMVQAGARMRGRDLVAPSGAVVMPNLTLLQAAKARQFTREAPNAQQDQSQPAPSVPVQAAPQGPKQQSAVAPAQDLSSEAPLARPNIKESRNGTDNSLPNAEVAQKAPEGGGVVIRGGGNAVDARAGAGAEPKGRMPPESNPGVGQGALDANGEVAEQPNPAESDSGVPDARTGGSSGLVAKRPTPSKPEGSSIDRAVRTLMDRTNGNGSPDGLIGPENQDARAEIISALTGKPAESLSVLEKSLSAMETQLHRAAGITEGSIKERRSRFIDWIDSRSAGAEESAAPPANQNPIKTETRANTGPEAEVASANKETRMTSQEWRDKGKSPSDLLNEKVDSLGRELAMTVAEEASQKDFAPSEIPSVVRMWANDERVPADSLRIAVLKHLPDFGLSDGRIKQIRNALSPLNAKNQEPTKLSVDLESLFADLDSSTVRKANKAKKAAKAHPLADKIQNVHDTPRHPPRARGFGQGQD